MCEWVGVVVGEERVVLIAGYNYTTVHIHNSRSVAEGPWGAGGVTGWEGNKQQYQHSNHDDPCSPPGVPTSTYWQGPEHEGDGPNKQGVELHMENVATLAWVIQLRVLCVVGLAY